jgi:hypothetical protein
MDKISELMEAFGKLDATNQSPEDSIAAFILANIKGSHSEKRAFVANALQAYARLLQESGVKA